MSDNYVQQLEATLNDAQVRFEQAEQELARAFDLIERLLELHGYQESYDFLRSHNRSPLS